jgi:arylsulfatase A-like enzyme
MPDPFAFVNTPLRVEDETGRMPELLQIIAESEQPYFAHIHLLGTHGPTYDPISNTYSGGSSQSDEWMPDFYDDAILDFDGYLQQIFSALESTDQMDHTVVILYTDHPRTRDTVEKIPLVIWFPRGEFSGIIHENTNNLDIAPTIMDYLGLNKPDWMEGTSLINGKLDPLRPIYGAIWRRPRTPGGKPPFFEFGNFRVTICQRYVDYKIIDGSWSSGFIQNYTGYCPSDSLPSIEEMQDILIARIKADGYDTTIMESSRQ